MATKKLFFDIETSPNIGFFWNAGYKQNIPYDNIIQERAIICICYKWEGKKEIHSLTWDANQDDKKMLEQFIKIANEADEIIAQNGDKFDIPWIRTRCLFHKISMFPSYTTLDTLKKARSGFRFNSNTLNYMAGFLGIGHKNDMRFDDWKNIVLLKDKKALDKMVVYCKKDVLLLEKVYNELSPYITNKAHHGILSGKGKCSCPECGSKQTAISKIRYTATGLKRIQLQCKSCGKYNTVAESTYEKEKT